MIDNNRFEIMERIYLKALKYVPMLFSTDPAVVKRAKHNLREGITRALDAYRVIKTSKKLQERRAEIKRLRSRVFWLDHLDTEEGRKAHANEALLVEIEQLKAELAKLKECTP